MNNRYRIYKCVAKTGDRCIDIAHYIIEEKATVRAAAKKFGISKSTVHKDVTITLQRKNPALANEVKKILDKNKMERHLRGGEATKKRYELEKLQKNEKKTPKKLFVDSPN